MHRTLYLCHSPLFTYNRLESMGVGRTPCILTPTPKAAKAIGVPHQSLDTLARHFLARQGLGVASPLVSYRTLKAVVAEADHYFDAEGSVNALMPGVKELLHADCDLEGLEAHSSRRVSNLARVTRLYRKRLKDLGLIDAAELFVAARSAVTGRVPVTLYGYAFLAADELAFVNALADAGSRIFLPYREHDYFLENLEAQRLLENQGWVIEKHCEQGHTTGEQLAARFVDEPVTAMSQVKAHVYPHLEAEVRGVLGQVKALMLAGVSAEDIVVVSRDDTVYGPTVLSVAWEYDIPVRALYGVPLGQTRFGGWFRLLLEAVQKNMPYEVALRLLCHPYSPMLDSDALQKARLQHPQGAERWAELGVDTRLFNWPPFDSGEGWIARLNRLFQMLRVLRGIERFSREVRAFKSLQENLPLLACAQQPKVSRDTFIYELLEMLQLISVPVQPGRGGVELHTPLALFGSRYPYVFVMGMAEGILPAPVRNDYRLDFFDRAGLIGDGIGLKGIEKAARHEGLAFYALLQIAAESVTFSYSRLVQNKEQLESPYLSDLQLNPSPLETVCLGSIEEARRVWLKQQQDVTDPVLDYARHAYAVEYSRESPAPYDEYDGYIGLPVDPAARTFTVSELTALGQCRFKWFAQKLLGLKPPEEAEMDLTPAAKGSLYHDVLELVCTWARDADNPRAVMLERLEEAFARVEVSLALTTVSTWGARRIEHLDMLRRVIQSDGFIPENHRILSLEQRFEGEWQGLSVRGRIDRIDLGPDGLVMIDYKTSASKPKGIQDASGELKLDLQLPVYLQAAPEVLFPGQPVGGAYYYSVTKGKVLSRLAPQATPALETFVKQLGADLQAGFYPVKPDRKEEACAYCEMDLVCRKGPRLAQKEITP